MTFYQFVLAVLDKLPQLGTFLVALGGFIAGLFTLWKQRVNKAEIKSDIQNGKSDTLAAVGNVHAQINGRMDQLIATTKSDSHASGMADQRQADTDEKNIIGKNEIH